jgi:membrane-associated protein
LAQITSEYGLLTYGILFLIVFMETGLVITPFLPGDSLLFAAGALSALGSFEFWWLYPLMLIAAIVGDTVNYWIGDKFEKSVFDKGSRIFKKEYLEQAEEFYAKHGGKAIVFARFVPIVRTFAPFVAGISKMHYGDFIKYNAIGGFAWVTLFLGGGALFGNLPIVKENFHYMVVGIIGVSVIPILVEVRKRRKSVIK